MELHAQLVVESLLGKPIFTPSHGNPNRILEVNSTRAVVATERSPKGEPVSIPRIQQGLDILLDTGDVPITPSTFDNYRRSSAIGAILASLPATEVVGSDPARIRPAENPPLQQHLRKAAMLTGQPHGSPVVVAADPLHKHLAKALPESILLYIDDAQLFTVRGSAGQMNFPWAETPWAAILNRLVTHTPQQGHYLVFLFDGNGEDVYLSLNQGVTEASGRGENDYCDHLAKQAAQLRTYLPSQSTKDLILGSIKLTGTGRRTRGYAAANVAAIHFHADELPHDVVLAMELRRFLGLYEATTAGVDQEQANLDIDLPEEAKKGQEAKRYRWHLRAEGRNSAMGRRAKQLQGYACQICDRDFENELGVLGKQCIEAHHLVPFQNLDSQPRDLDPEEDFAIVCANCHRMLHSKTPPLTPEQLRDLLERMKSAPASSSGAY